MALHALSTLRRELEAFERVQAWKALDAGSSYGSVARALGISRQAAHRRYRELAAATEPPLGAEPTSPRLRVAPEARAAVQLAGEEATRMGAVRMGSEHLLLGILRAGDGKAAAVLRAAGVTLEAARARRPADARGRGAARGRHHHVRPPRLPRGAARRRGRPVARDQRVRPPARRAARPGGGAHRTLEALGVSTSDVRARL